MNRIFRMFLFTVSVFSFAACNSNNTTATNSVHGDSTTTAPPSADTTKNTAPSGNVALDQLPASVKDFVAKNYHGYTMKSAVHDPLCSGGDAIDVAIGKKGSPDYSLIFLPDGTFVQQEQDVDISKAPAGVLKIAKTKYAGFTPAQQIERLTLADKSTQYLLDLAKDKTTKEVIFNDAGTVICEH